MQNYECCRNVGHYKPGTVLPEWAVERAGPVADQVANGTVKPTDKKVNVTVAVPEPRKAADPTPALVDEANGLRRANGELEAHNRSLAAQNAGLREQVAARDKALGQQTEDVEHLKRACDEHQAKCDELAKEVAKLTELLDAATRPAPGGRKAKHPEPAGA